MIILTAGKKALDVNRKTSKTNSDAQFKESILFCTGSIITKLPALAAAQEIGELFIAMA